jgi:hypothetical protein
MQAKYEPTQSAVTRWFAEIIEGPVLGPFDTRDEALHAECEFVLQNNINPGSWNGKW